MWLLCGPVYCCELRDMEIYTRICGIPGTHVPLSLRRSHSLCLCVSVCVCVCLSVSLYFVCVASAWY